MNVQRIYSQASGRDELTQKRNGTITPDGNIQTPPKVPDAARQQIKIAWLESTITQELLQQLNSQIQEYIAEATMLAVTFPQHQNHHKIIQLLVRANTVQQMIKNHTTL